MFASSADAASIGRPTNNSDLVGFWDFNVGYGGTTVYDRSGNGVNGTMEFMDPETDWVNGKKGWALDFDGANDTVNLGNTSVIDGASEMTMCAWIYFDPASVDADYAIVGKWDSTGWLMWVDDSGAVHSRQNTIAFAPDVNAGSGGRAEAPNDTVTSQTWEHFCGTFSGGNYIRIYENGVLVDERTSGITGSVASVGHDHMIGNSANGTGIPEFDGKIDEVRIYDRALTQAQIESVHTSTGPKVGQTPIVVSDGLVGHWTFDGGVTNTTITEDMSGNGFNGSLSGGSVISNGRIGQALTFDGVDGRVVLPTSASYNVTDNFTFALWFKPTNTTQSGNYLYHYSDSAEQHAIVYEYVDDQVEFFVGSTAYTGTQPRTGSQLSVTDTNWHHIVYTYDGTNWRGYVNGDTVFDVERTFAVESTDSNGTIAACGSGCYSASSIDDFRIYNRALSPGEVKRLYNGTRPSQTSAVPLSDGLVGYYNFSFATDGTTVIDRSGGASNNGTLTNATGTVNWNDGKVGNGMIFDGENDFVDLPDDVLSESEGAISMWVKTPNSFTGDPSLRMAFGTFAGSNARVYLGTESSGNLYAALSTSADFGDYALSTDTWHHLTLVWRSDSTGEVFVDGISRGTRSGFTIGTITNENIGSYSNGTDSLWEGLIDEVRIYNRALTNQEIGRLYRLGL